MAIIKGLNEFQKRQQQDRAKGFDPSTYLYVGDGDTALVRFLTDGPEVIAAYYHSYPTGRRSTRGRPIFETVYCSSDEGEDCAFCSRLGRPESNRRRMLSLYVWVYSVVNNVTGEERHVDQVRVLRTGSGKNGAIVASFQTFMRKYGSLTDRDYEWSRIGASADDTTYTLLPDDKSDILPAIVQAVKGIPPLEDIVRGKAALPDRQQQDSPQRVVNVPSPRVVGRQAPVSLPEIPTRATDDDSSMLVDNDVYADGEEEQEEVVVALTPPTRRVGRPAKAVESKPAIAPVPNDKAKSLLQRLREKAEQARQGTANNSLGEDI